jgi:hypothetical protein
MSYVATVEFPACWVHILSDLILTIFKADRTESVFAPPKDEHGNYLPDFIAAAHEMGYTDLMQYAAEHELAHQHVSLALGREYSWVVWQDAHSRQEHPVMPPWTEEWPGTPSDEEHLVNRLQQFVNLGIEDSYGCLRAAFGERLEEIARQFVMLRNFLDE